MSNPLAPNKVGLALGAFLGLWHLLWSVLVVVGLAQPLLNMIFTLHMIQPPYIVQPFSLTMAISLIIVTAVIGYIFGYVIAMIWNAVLGINNKDR